MTFQVTGNPEKIDAFIDLLKPYGIKELTRTGVTAFVRETQKVITTAIHFKINNKQTTQIRRK